MGKYLTAKEDSRRAILMVFLDLQSISTFRMKNTSLCGSRLKYPLRLIISSER
jgi:hypothetical protein